MPEPNSQTEQRVDWENVSPDPDLQQDLGYTVDDWESVTARRQGEEHLLFLPSDEAMLHDEAFLVVDPDIVEELASNL